jgi:YVTN family beta-propeller protein
MTGKLGGTMGSKNIGRLTWTVGLMALGAGAGLAGCTASGNADSGSGSTDATQMTSDTGIWPDAAASSADSAVWPDANTPMTDGGPNADATSHPDAMLSDTATVSGLDGGMSDGPLTDTGTVVMGTDGGIIDGGSADAGPIAPTTNGSAVALSTDDTIAVTANRGAGTISVFNVGIHSSPPTSSRLAVLDVANTDPWSVVMSPDNTIAYVVLRAAQRVIQVTNLTGTPTISPAFAAVGSEPSGIAISPHGSRLYVTNWGEGTVTVIRTADMSIAATVDLNASLAGSGALGNIMFARPGMAHPFAVVVTNNTGDDLMETVFVTEFFSQATTTTSTDDTYFDTGRQGLVYRIETSDNRVLTPVTIGAVANTGFNDSNGQPTGCFPNQLFAEALINGRLYVTSICTSPKGPVGPVVTNGMTDTSNFKTELHSALFVIDAANSVELPNERLILTQQFQQHYDTLMQPDDATRRFPLIPRDLAFVPLGSSYVAYVVAFGSDALFRIEYNMDGSLAGVGSSTEQFINLATATSTVPGRLPIGIALAHLGGKALVLNQNSRTLSFISFATQAVTRTAQATPPPMAGSFEDHANKGHRFFVTGLGRWSFKGQGWNSCESCHVFGLSDQVTWFFARGPRQTIPLDAAFDKANLMQQRIFNWTAINDEMQDFETNTRGNSGGVGAIVHANQTSTRGPQLSDRIIFDGTQGAPGADYTTTLQNGLNGSTKSLMPNGSNALRSVIDDWNNIEAWVTTVRTPRAPTNLVMADVAAGAQIFADNNCAGCHGGDQWTISRLFYTPSEMVNNPTTGSLKTATYMTPAAFPAALNPPSNVMGRHATLRFSGAGAGANDQINCVLRAVGTYPAMLDASDDGVSPAGVRVREVRGDMSTAAQGTTGFNPPSLLGLASGAPFYHAGNARTLEEVFDAAFTTHTRAFSSNFSPSATDIRQLVEFLLSIDGSTTPVAVPGAAALGFSPILCPTTFP